MRNVSQHFNRSEFACKCGCGFNTIDAELVATLERIRKWAGAPVVINSGCRCKPYNKTVGGSPTSRHMEGKAADIVVKGFSPEAIASLVDEWYPDDFGVVEYKSWVHIDVRDGKYRDKI